MYTKTHTYPYFYTPYLVLITMYPSTRVLAENLVGLRSFLVVRFQYKTNPNPRKWIRCWEKKNSVGKKNWANCHF